jgi:serine protease Do
LRQGDIILRFAGKEIKDARQLQLVVAEATIGQKVDVEIFRDGKVRNISVTLEKMDSASASQQSSAGPQAGWLGMTVEELPGNLRISGLRGVLITEVDPGGMAAETGIQRGDVIISVNQNKIAGLSDYARAMKEAERKGNVAILVKRGKANIYFALKIR